jgi:diguanylate cyclase (GGDEF)-like protein
MAQPMDGAGTPTPAGRVEGGPAQSRRRSEFQRRAHASLLLEVAIADVTLGCHNRAYLAHRARDEVARRARYGHRLSLLLLAADGQADPTEEGLKAIVAAANLALRPTDTLARWQGGDLVVLLPSTGLAGAIRLARRLCAHVVATGAATGRPLAASIGAATALGRQEGLELLIQRARVGLAEARAAGGGRVGIG